MQDNRIDFLPLKDSDVEVLTPIMKRAFDKDAQIHLHEEEGGPEGYDNGGFIRKWGFAKGATAYKITVNGETAGLVILWINAKTHHNCLGCIFLDTIYQNQGLGEQVWKMVEDRYPDTISWRTETPGFSRRNHYFYVMKCGFKIVRIENPMDLHEANYIMEKVM
jgi:GNAT superfamily N-acetyltransferase